MNIYEKLAVVQQETKAPKDKKNTFGGYNYRSAEGILEAVKPVLAKHDATIGISDEIVEIGGRIYVKSTAIFMDLHPTKKLVYEDGFMEDIDVPSALTVTAYAREAETKKGMDESQITGTASSYARKYALNGLLLLDDTKDADTDEYAKTERASMVKEIRDLAKQAKVAESHIETQIGMKLEQMDPDMYAKVKTSLLAKMNLEKQAKGG